MEKHKMKYNSQIEKLRIPEYGRNVQNLINYISEMEDDEKRQVYTDYMVNLMYFINKENNNSSDKKSKLWKHAVIISGYDLDVTLPDGSPIEKEDTVLDPEQVEYPVTEAKYRHYGHYVQELIKKAVKEEDEEQRKKFAKVIGSYMKLAYVTWNKQHYVNDDSIKQDLKNLSNGKLTVDDDVSFNFLKNSNKNQRSNNSRKGRRRKKKRGRRR